MKLEVESCDLGLSDRYGLCGLDTEAELPRGAQLSPRQRLGRALAGLGFHALALPLARKQALRPVAVVAHWFGASHLVASLSGYPGCPELGAIPSLALRRRLATECGPWEWIDRRLGLADGRSGDQFSQASTKDQQTRPYGDERTSQEAPPSVEPSTVPSPSAA
jgi:hypothetical protein